MNPFKVNGISKHIDNKLIVVIETGNVFSIESLQYVAIYPDGTAETFWSAPLFDFMTREEKLQGALDYVVEQWRKKNETHNL